MSAVFKSLLVLALAVASEPVCCERFYYVEPGVASCPAAPVATLSN